MSQGLDDPVDVVAHVHGDGRETDAAAAEAVGNDAQQIETAVRTEGQHQRSADVDLRRRRMSRVVSAVSVSKQQQQQQQKSNQQRRRTYGARVFAFVASGAEDAVIDDEVGDALVRQPAADRRHHLKFGLFQHLGRRTTLKTDRCIRFTFYFKSNGESSWTTAGFP